VKVYRRKYLRKGNYVCRSYYLYLPKGVAEPLVGKELRIVQKRRGVLIEPIALDTNVAREHLPIRAGSFSQGILYRRENLTSRRRHLPIYSNMAVEDFA